MKKVLTIGLVLIISMLALNLNSIKPEKEPVYTVILPYTSFTTQDLYNK